LREICPPKNRTPESGPNIGAIAGELLNSDNYLMAFLINNSIFDHILYVIEELQELL
jgi:hypothetical protein